MSTVGHAVIAAAGLGSRLGMGKPKCLIEFDGISILQHQLDLLRDVKDVRVVVGFEEQQVIDLVRHCRPDAIIVRNAAFRSTTTLHSYLMGAQGVKGNCVFMDGDIVFSPVSFAAFLAACERDVPLVGVTAAKTQDAVFAGFEDKQVRWFSRERTSAFEWANLAWVPPGWFESPDGNVFERLSKHLPLRGCEVDSFEVDTAADHVLAAPRARQFFAAQFGDFRPSA